MGVRPLTLRRCTRMPVPPPQSCHTGRSSADSRPPQRWTRWRHWLGLGPAGAPPDPPAGAGGAVAPDEAWNQLVRLLPADLDATAHATGALRRRRQVGSARALLWLVLAYAVADWSLRL